LKGCCFYSLAEGILISVRSLQRSEGDVSDPIKILFLFLYPCRGYYGQSEVCNAVKETFPLRSLQSSEGDVSDPSIYILDQDH